jgi:hypothetical protein
MAAKRTQEAAHNADAAGKPSGPTMAKQTVSFLKFYMRR